MRRGCDVGEAVVPAIVYKVWSADERCIEMVVDTERRSASATDSPGWTRLAHHRCPNCPLAVSDTAHCPAAQDMAPVAVAFEREPSHARVRVEVLHTGRTFSQDTDVQSAMRSLLGLVLATSGCPILSQMKGPARLHMPFATIEETLFRMVGAYLVGQYLETRGHPTWGRDLSGMHRMYHDIQTVNRHLSLRLVDVACGDASANAMASLAAVAELLSFSLNDHLQELEPFAIRPTRPVTRRV